MKKVPYRNKSASPAIVGGVTIAPGAMRLVPENALKRATQPGKPLAPPAPERSLVDRTIPEITKALPGLSEAELVELEKAEQEGKTRKGVLSAIAEERIRRAQEAGQGEGGTGQTGDAGDGEGGTGQTGDAGDGEGGEDPGGGE